MRPKRKRVLISPQYEEKIDKIDGKLDQIVGLLKGLRQGFSVSPTRDNFTTQSRSLEGTALPLTPQIGLTDNTAHTVPGTSQAVETSDDTTRDMAVTEGQSSLTAHSVFGFNYMQRVVGSSLTVQESSDMSELLSTLRHMVVLFKNHRSTSKNRLPFAQLKPQTNSKDFEMPPLRIAFAIMQHAQAESDIFYLSLCHLLSPRCLSDLCLKVYCSSDYSDDEGFIVNAALYFLAVDLDMPHYHAVGQIKRESIQQICRANMETILAGLSLYVDGNFDTILTLFIGALYALESSRTHLACTLITTAYQCSCSLGYHTECNHSDAVPDNTNQCQLLFWIIYYLEKVLCLRLGRPSTIAEYDIAILRPQRLRGSRHYHLDYINLQLKLANLSGRIYEQLYSADALRIPRTERTQRAQRLALEMDAYFTEEHSISQAWCQYITDSSIKEQIRLLLASDKVFRLSLLTLIYQAIPKQDKVSGSFSEECVSSAREALDCNRESARELRQEGLSVMSAYINWTLLFAPFTPFIVIFCHVIETGCTEDLHRMQTFVESIQGCCQCSSTIAKHHSLFEAFYKVALHYTKLKSPSVCAQREETNLRAEVDFQLNELGLQLQGPCLSSQSQGDQPLSSSFYTPEALGESHLERLNFVGHSLDQYGVWGDNWYSFNQQVIGLMDQDELICEQLR